MRNLLECILERLTINQAREYLMIERDPRSQAWLDAFWERVKEVPGAEVSKNGHRIYFKFELPSKELEMGEQQDSYAGSPARIKNKVYNYLINKKDFEINKFDYIHGKFTYWMDTQRGKKEREMLIGKALKDNKELKDEFASDPIRLTSNLDAKKMMIVLSNHAYDIAGMSTDRKWTSCMNIISGSNSHWIKEDIKWGTIVAYLIEESDKNINNPLGRILIKPYLDDHDAIVYYPEPTVYSPYVGLDSMKEYLQEMCNHIANEISWLYKIVRDKNDINQEAPDRETVDKSMMTKKDWKIIDDLTDKEWQKLEKEDNLKYKFLLYYDDYFAKNKDYVGIRPQTSRSNSKKMLKKA